MVEFKDDPKYQDDDEIPLTKTDKWIPAKELFNIVWQHRALFEKLAANPQLTTDPQVQTELEAMAKQEDDQINRFVKLP